MESSVSHGCSFVISLLHETHWHPMCLHLVSHTDFRLSSLWLRFSFFGTRDIGAAQPSLPGRVPPHVQPLAQKTCDGQVPGRQPGVRSTGELTQNWPTPYIIQIGYRHAPVAQLDRASDFESAGRAFESHRAYFSKNSGFHANVSRCFFIVPVVEWRAKRSRERCIETDRNIWHTFPPLGS